MDYSGKITLQSIGEFIKSKLSGKSDKGHTHSKSDITDFPSSLPANGGNADTVDGLHAEKFMRYEPDKSIVTSINDMITPGTYGVYTATPDFPTGYGTWGLLEVQAYGSICYQIIKFESGIIINRAKIVNQTEWSKWKEISTTQIYSTTVTATTDVNGNAPIWALSNDMIPISAYSTLNLDIICTPLVAPNELWYLAVDSAWTHDKLAATSCTFIVNYIRN